MSATTYTQKYATTDNQTAGAFLFDTISSQDVAISKIAFGALGSITYVDASNPLPVTFSGTMTVTGAGGTFPVTDSGGSLTVDNSGTFAVQAAQAGTWTVQPGNTANTTAWLVTGTGGTFPITVAAGATNIAKAEDVASADADVGVPAMAVRKVSPANTSGADGDYEFLQMSAGRLWTSTTIDAALPAGSNAIGAVTQSGTWNVGTVTTVTTVSTVTSVTNVATIGTSVTPGTSAAHLGKAEDAAHTTGDTGVMLLAVRESTATDLSAGATNGDYEPLQVDANGRLWGVVNIDQMNGVAVSMGNGVSGTGVQRVTIASDSTGQVALAAGSASIGKLGSNSGVTIGAVEIAAAQTLATVTTVGTVSSVTTVSGLSGGNTAHDGAGSGVRPLLVGFYASAAAPTDVSADGDATDAWCLRNGAQCIQPTYAGILATTGNGVSGTGVPRVTLASDSTGNIATIGTSVTPGTSAAHLGKAEDAAHGDGDTGVMALAVRKNTAASTSGSDGDYQPLITNTTGHLWVDASGQTLTVGAHNVTNAGTFAVQATIASGATSIAKAEDVASADADVGVGCLAVRKATPGNTSGTDGDYEFLQISAGRLWCSATIDAALPAGSNAIGAVTQSGTWNIGTVTTVTTVSTVTTCSTVTTLTGSGVAHDGVDSGNPHKAGARCALTLSDDTIVSNADRTDNVSDGDGTLLVRNQFPLGDLTSERVSDTGGTSTAFSNFGATANTRNVITAITVYNSSATGGYVDFRDGTAGSILFTVPLPAGGGAVLGAGSVPYFKTTANTALAYDVSAALTTVYISISGFRSKVV